MACAYEKLKKYEDASQEFKHAISVDEKWPDAHYGLALCSLKLGKNADAVNDIESAVKWSIDDYESKVRRREQRKRERRRALEEAILKGETALPAGLGKNLDSLATGPGGKP